MRLIVQPGIRKPAQLKAALTIRTTWTPPGAEALYADEVSPDGSLRYKMARHGTTRTTELA